MGYVAYRVGQNDAAEAPAYYRRDSPVRIKFAVLAEHYLKADFGADAVRPKSENTTIIVEHIVRDYLVARWGTEIAEEIKPLDIQRWFKSLHSESKLAWTTISKMRGVMSRIYKIGILRERVTKNPVLHVETRCKSAYRAIVIDPAQTFSTLKSLTNILHHMLVLTCAATALRSSEILALRWADILWEEERVRVSKCWANGKDGDAKTEASDGYGHLHHVLAHHLRHGTTKRPIRRPRTLVFRPSRRVVSFPCPLARSLPIIFGPRQDQPGAGRKRPEVRTSQSSSLA
jgi:integrase